MASSSFENIIGVNADLIKKALTIATKPHRVPGAEHYYLYEAAGSTVFFSFPGSFIAADWLAPSNQGPFGEVKIDRKQFPCLRSIANDEDATVNEAFLRNLGVLLTSPSFHDKVTNAVEQRKRIVFTGHSSGGATAILATVWFLETCLKQKPTPSVSPLCVTFGSPLVGDRVFKHALGRENWASFFLNFVTRYDVVPRLMLVPKSSINQTLNQILHLLDPRSAAATSQEGGQRVPEFYMTVIRNASAVASRVACQLMGNTNPLLETLSAFVELSPYRPFGTYVFCTNTVLVAVNNAEAVLQLLFHSFQCDENEWPRVAYQSIEDHQNYERQLQGSSSIYRLDHQFPLSFDGRNSNAILSDLGLSTRGILSVRAVMEAEKQLIENQRKVKSRQGEIREKLQWIEDTYKRNCDVRRVGYYDSFKASKEEEDFKANVRRAELAGIYDEVIEMLKNNQLPDAFEGQEEWINLATMYRRLVEPLDIANYYRHLKNEDTGPYMEKGRPNRYKCTQRWTEHEQWKLTGTYPENSFWAKVNELNLRVSAQDICEKLKTAGSKYESCFWAEVEELSGKSYEEIWVRAKMLEIMLQVWIESRNIDKQSLGGLTFRKWWDTLPHYHKIQSPIAWHMQN